MPFPKMRIPNTIQMPAAARRAFTLVEIMVSGALFVLMIALVMGMVISQSKFGLAIGNYADMNEYSRKVISQLEQDMRLTRSVSAISSTSLDANVVPPT